MAVTQSTPRVAYTLSGSAESRTVVFVNGIGGAQAAFSLQVRAFMSDHQVLTYDHRGMGGSEIVDAPVHMADFAQDLVRVLDEAGISRADFVGLSFGGRVLQQLAAGWPERVRRMVVGGTSAGGDLHVPSEVNVHQSMRDAVGGDATDWANTVAPLLFGRSYREKYPERIRSLARWRARYSPSPVGLARQWEAWDSFDMSGQLEQIECPVLILHGTDDALSPMGNAVALQENLPNAVLVPLEGIGHSPNVEDTDRFNKEIREFFSQS
jgi:3-oxoadipate enol-lactonase